MGNVEIPTLGLDEAKLKIHALPDEGTLALYLNPQGMTSEKIKGDLRQIKEQVAEDTGLTICVDFSTTPHRLVAVRPSQGRLIMDRHEPHRFFVLHDEILQRVDTIFDSFPSPQNT